MVKEVRRGLFLIPFKNYHGRKGSIAEKHVSLFRIRKLTQARKYIAVKSRQKMFAEDYVNLLNHVLKMLAEQLSPALNDVIQKRIRDLQKPAFSDDVEERELQIKAIRGICVEPASFSDDGPMKALKALRRLDVILQSDERLFLEECSQCLSDEIPACLAKGDRIETELDGPSCSSRTAKGSLQR